MQWDAITDQWLWFIAAAAAFVALVVILAAFSLRKRKPHRPIQNQQYPAIQSQQNGWTPTGRIDFVDPQAIGSFLLQVEDTRIVDSIGGVERREIRWRKATLDEAKTVLVAYHSQRNLTMTANFIVTSSKLINRSSDLRNEQREAEPRKEEGSGGGSQA
jgi:hypothetical protein